MASKRLELLLIAKEQGMVAALKATGSAADEAGRKTDTSGKLMAGALAGAAIAAGAFAMKSVQAFSDVGTDVLKLQKVLGGTPEQMSALRFAAKQTNVDVDTLGAGMAILAKKLAASKDPMRDFGLNAKDASGHLRPIDEILPQIADKVAALPPGFERTALATQYFGRAGKELLPLLAKGSAGLEELRKKAADYGLILSGDQLKAIKENKQAQRDLQASFEGLQVKVGNQLMPVMTKFTQVLSAIPGPVADVIMPVSGLAAGLLGLAVIGSKTYTALGPLITKLRDMNSASAEAGGAFSSLGSKLAAGAGIVTAAAVGYELISKRLDEGAKNAAEMGDAIQQKLNKKQNIDELRGSVAQMGAQVQGLSSDLENSTALWDVFYRHDLVEGRKQLRLTAESTNVLISVVEAYARAHGISTDAAYQAVTGQMAEKRSQDELGDSYDATNEKIKEQQDALRAATDPTFAMVDATHKNEDAQRAAAKAAADLTQAQKDAAYAHLVYLPTSQQVKDADQKLAEAQQALTDKNFAAAKSAQDVSLAQIEMAAKVKAGQLPIGEAKKALREWVEQGLITPAVAAQMSQQISEAAGKFLNLASAAAQARDVLATLPQTFGQTIGVDAGAQKFGGMFAKALEGHAGGGSLSSGWNLVGEQGPELIPPGNGGRSVIPAGPSAAMLSGGGDIHITVEIDGHAVGHAIHRKDMALA